MMQSVIRARETSKIQSMLKPNIPPSSSRRHHGHPRGVYWARPPDQQTACLRLGYAFVGEATSKLNQLLREG